MPKADDMHVEDAIKALTEVVSSAQTVVSQHDIDRLQAGCSLVNTFNFAVQVQAGRVQWQESDYKAFLIALCAMDAIGKTATENRDRTKD